MQYICGESQLNVSGESVVALGNFDGVHMGHQKLLKTALGVAKKQQRIAIALSFYPHPTKVLSDTPKPLVMARRDRKNKMKAIGVDLFIEYPFTKEFAKSTPQAFFEEVLVKKLHVKTIVIGSNYYFGKNKAGDVAFLKEMGARYDVQIEVVDTVEVDGTVVSSTHIRELIQEGALERAKTLLGSPYTIVGSVVHGKKLGRTIGYPTINVIADPDRVYPPNGVYATYVKVYDTLYMGITNIGYNPTVGGTQKTVETHIMHFSQDIYGEEVEVMFHHMLRPEKKFESIQALSQQIARDEEKARFLLGNDSK